MTSNVRKQIVSSLMDKEYRDEFVSEEVNEILPAQIRALRENTPLTQKELAKKLGTTQTVVSQLENPNYGRYSLSTLKRLASVFDVGLIVRFVPFSELIDRAVNLDSADLIVPRFSDDKRLHSQGLTRFAKYSAVTGKQVKTWLDMAPKVERHQAVHSLHGHLKRIVVSDPKFSSNGTASVKLPEGYSYGKTTQQEKSIVH